jgi:nitrite reductase/ring-hydroxylating ferredoxin subunit
MPTRFNRTDTPRTRTRRLNVRKQTPAAKPFPIHNAACPLHETPIHFDPATGRVFCPACAAAKCIRAAVRAGEKRAGGKASA